MVDYNRILLDADSIIYKIGFACDNHQYQYKGKLYEKKKIATKEWEEDGKPEEMPIIPIIQPESKGVVKSTLIAFIEDKLEPYKFIDTNLFIGKGRSFRYNIATRLPYKGNREGRELPTHYEFIKMSIVKMYPTVQSRPGFESDDEISWMAREGDLVVSIDKDLLQIPAYHYNFDTKQECRVDEFEGIKRVACQMLVGDTADNVLGIGGVGPTSSYLSNIMNAENVQKVFSIVLAVYQTHYGCYSFQFMRENFILLRLLRATPTPYELFFMDRLNINKGYWE